MDRPGWAPDDVDIERPSVARVYDYFLGGSHNFAVDRAFAEEALRTMPSVTTVAQENRAFLRRAVRYLCGQGVRQFIDLGSGIPTVGNVHEVAGAADPAARTVYVDIDPVAYAHSRAILAGNPHATVIRADLRRPAEVLAHPALRRHVDFDQPVAVLLVGVLHFVPDEERPADIVAGYARAGAPGSHVVVSHASAEGRSAESDEVVRMYAKSASSIVVRTAEEVTGVAERADGGRAGRGHPVPVATGPACDDTATRPPRRGRGRPPRLTTETVGSRSFDGRDDRSGQRRRAVRRNGRARCVAPV